MADRFDWEPRPIRQGELDINRRQRREISDLKLQEYTKCVHRYIDRAKWEVASSKKSEFVASMCRQMSRRGDRDDPAISTIGQSTTTPRGATPSRSLVVDQLRQEEQEKKACREAERQRAGERRDALLLEAAKRIAAREKSKDTRDK